MPFSELFPENQFPTFEPGFPPWDHHEPPFLFHQDGEPDIFSPQPYQDPVSSNSGSDSPVTPNSGSDKPQMKKCRTIAPGSDKTGPLGSITDERKRRRMISNRESARRSRMRKQKHLENLRNQLNRLRVGNREVMNRVRLVVLQNQLVRRENENLRSEAVMLRQRLWDIRQVLLVRQLQQHLNPSAWPCNNFTSINDPRTITTTPFFNYIT